MNHGVARQQRAHGRRSGGVGAAGLAVLVLVLPGVTRVVVDPDRQAAARDERRSIGLPVADARAPGRVVLAARVQGVEWAGVAQRACWLWRGRAWRAVALLLRAGAACAAWRAPQRRRPGPPGRRSRPRSGRQRPGGGR